VTNTVQLLAAVAGLKPKEPATIGIQRGNKAMDLKVIVTQRPKTQARREQ
jgi:S1-C subfamily serine protease